MPKGFEYWVGQIQAAKDDHKVFFEDAKKCNEAYCKERSYNIFYSNVNVLEANLLTNDPMPDIQRRFLKRLENDKLKSAAYSEVAKIAGAAIEYYSDISGLYRQAKKAVHNSVKVGRGLVWVEYEPVISQVEGQEAITDRKFNILSLKYDEFLCSSAEDETKVWWAARRHLLTSQDLKQRFNYAATDSELSFSDKQNSQTNKKRGEVW
jgi:hypothetical protein